MPAHVIPKNPAQRQPERQIPWMRGRVADLLVGCGGWSAPLLALVYALNLRFAGRVGVAFYALGVLVVLPHYAATLRRAYGTRAAFEKYRVYTREAAFAAAGILVLVHVFHGLLPYLFTVYVTWAAWHFSTQNYGIALLLAERAGVEPSRRGRLALYGGFAASCGVAALAMHVGPSGDPYFVSLGLPAPFARVSRYALAVAALGGWALALREFARSSGLRRLAGVAVVLSTQLLWFALPTALEMLFGVPFPRTGYATGAILFMHSAQYLWIAGFYARREAAEGALDPAAPGPSRSFRRLLAYASLVAGGIALFLAGPWIASFAFGHDFTASVLIFLSVVNLHHFLLDGAIWRLRDPDVRAVLLGDVRALGGGRAEHVAAPWPRLPRSFGIAVAACVLTLFALAGLDVARYALVAGEGDESHLAVAERLNPHDAVVHAAIGRAQAAAGRTDEAIASLGRAIDSDPYNAGAQRALARLLLETGRYTEAYAQHEKMLAYVRPDPDTLTNFGLVAMQMNKPDAAVDAWQRAIALDPDQSSAQLYLADALSLQGKGGQAVEHYAKYLELVGRPDFTGAVDPRRLVVVALKLGDEYDAQGNQFEAGEYFRQAAALSQKVGDPEAEAAALSRLASLYADAGDNVHAVDCYTRAIKLRSGLGDRHAEAIDWYNYAKFLQDIGADPRLVVAGLLAAQAELGDAAPEKERRAAESALGEAGQLFGPAMIDGVKTRHRAVLDEALAFDPEKATAQ